MFDADAPSESAASKRVSNVVRWATRRRGTADGSDTSRSSRAAREGNRGFSRSPESNTESPPEPKMELTHARDCIDHLGTTLDVPESVREHALSLFRRSLQRDLTDQRSTEVLAASTLYIACRRRSQPRSLNELSSAARSEQLTLGRAYRAIAEELDIELEPVNPKLYVPRYATALDIGDDASTVAEKVLDVCIDHDLHSGRSPPGFAAGAIYLAALWNGTGRTQQEVAAATKVSEGTVGTNYREQKQLLEGLGYRP